MVVFIHVLFPGKLGFSMESIARFAVPLFFIISGFFSYNITIKKIKTRIRHIACLFLASVLLYTLWCSSMYLLDNNITGLIEHFAKYLDINNWTKFLFFNVTISYMHLWYLVALVYVYIALFFAKKCNIKDNTIFWGSCILLIIHFIINYSVISMGMDIKGYVVRNYLTMGIPFFGLGMICKKYENKIKKVPSSYYVLIILIGLIETVLVRLCVAKNELYIGSVLIALSFMGLAVRYSEKTYSEKIILFTRCSSYIYIVHMIADDIVARTYSFINIQNLHAFHMLKPILTCILSTIIAFLFCKISKKTE